jgi:hypothetical protein
MRIESINCPSPRFFVKISFSLPTPARSRFIKWSTSEYQFRESVMPIIQFDLENGYISNFVIDIDDPQFEELYVCDLMRNNSFVLTFNQNP